MAQIDPERAKVLPLVEMMDRSELPPDIPPPRELVIAAGDESNYRSVGLGDARMFVGGSPRHWFFVALSQSYTPGLSIAEFGVTHHDITGKKHEESRFDHELGLDADLKLNEGDRAKSEMFSLMGGMLVDKVRRTGGLFFAGLEIRYRQINEEETIRWTQLVYSKALLDTQGILQEAIDRGISLPPWGEEAAKPQNMDLAAENMALSALILARK